MLSGLSTYLYSCGEVAASRCCDVLNLVLRTLSLPSGTRVPLETVPPSGAGGLRCRSARIDRRSTSSFSNWRAAHCSIEKIKIWENKGALWSIKYHFKIWKIGELNANIFKKYKSRSTGQIASGAKQELPPHTWTSWFGRPWDSCMRICIDLHLP